MVFNPVSETLGHGSSRVTDRRAPALHDLSETGPVWEALLRRQADRFVCLLRGGLSIAPRLIEERRDDVRKRDAERIIETSSQRYARLSNQKVKEEYLRTMNKVIRQNKV